MAKARLVAQHRVPMLIERKSGTGKELLAHAIHKASPRRGYKTGWLKAGIQSDCLNEDRNILSSRLSAMLNKA
jgi:DNA-binding NtrC family response regulator